MRIRLRNKPVVRNSCVLGHETCTTPKDLHAELMNEIKVSVEKLARFCAACFEKLGASAEHARLVADNLLFANLRGVDSHGLIRFKIYTERLRAGGFNVQAQPRVVS